MPSLSAVFPQSEMHQRGRHADLQLRAIAAWVDLGSI
jgi:hypothetical protein